jgi:hypothetical protein
MQTLKREEIYASACRDMEHLRVNLEDFIERLPQPASERRISEGGICGTLT